MNLTNLDITIKLMEAARQKDTLDMEYWQNRIGSAYLAYNIEDLHSCGNKACLAGHIAISREWSDWDGRIFENGQPFLIRNGKIIETAQALSDWFGVPELVVTALVYNFTRPGETLHPVYGELWKKVKATHVLKALTELKELGADEFIKKFDLTSIKP